MTKRNAIKAILGMVTSAFFTRSVTGQTASTPCVKIIPGNSQISIDLDYSACPPVKVTNTLMLALSDEKTEKLDQSMGLMTGNGDIDGIEIRYQGQSKILTARDIWDAL